MRRCMSRPPFRSWVLRRHVMKRMTPGMAIVLAAAVTGAAMVALAQNVPPGGQAPAADAAGAGGRGGGRGGRGGNVQPPPRPDPLPAFYDPKLPLEKRVDDLVSRLTLEEKVALMQMASPAIARLGIAPYDWWSEALHGVANAGTATVFPESIGMAA